ncbi:MAG: hypothetical protein U5Q16_10345 [Gammaproteobacteria bacterium]|nr:hypothetical protein [Gammaproteobacteria bacterium]
MNNAAMITIFVAFLSGCASNTGVVNLADGEYMIANQASTGFSGVGFIKADALKEAEQHCSDQDKDMEVVKLWENEGPYLAGKFPRIELTFRCK